MKNAGLMGRTAQRIAGAGFHAGQIGAFGWLATLLTLLALHGVIAVSPWNYRILVEEDGWVENLTVVAYLLAGALLLVAAWAETRRFPRFVFLAGCAGMAFIAGEEISWGQRILDFPTPDFLSRNLQGEFNVHNLPGPAEFLGRAFMLFIMLLGLTTAAALFSGKQGLLGIPLPSLPLLLALLSIPYVRISAGHLADGAELRFWFALFGHWQIASLTLLAAWALFCKRPALVLAVAASIMLCLACLHVHRHDIGWINADARELLWGLFWLCYAGELLHAARRGASGSVPLPSKPQGSGRESLPLWPAVSWLALAGAAGLLLATHFNVRMERPEFEAALGVVRSAAPDIRAEFDLHLGDGQLTYFKEPCEQADADAGMFFLHIFPKEPADLPGHRKRYGFDNLDFAFFRRGALIRDSCVAIASLPDYPIASIRTGQYLVGQYDEQGQLWSARLPMAD